MSLRPPESKTENRERAGREMGRFRRFGSHGTRKIDGQKPAQCVGSGQEKGPGDYPGPSDWWRRGELNPRPKALRPQPYMLITLFNFSRGNTACEAHPGKSLLWFGPQPAGMALDDPVIMTLHPRARAQVGSGLGLKRPERRRRRWRLMVCRWINEVSDSLGMRQAIS